MSTVTVLENIKAFLEENVCNNIKLKKPKDNNVDEFELVNPNVFIMNLPPKNFLPAGIDTIVPCVVIDFEDGSDDGNAADLSIRLVFAIWYPGIHEIDTDNNVIATPDGNAYMDLLNFIDKAKDEILKNQFLEGLVVEYPIKWGRYLKDEQVADTDPYYQGWITFNVKRKAYPKTNIDKLLE